jgi:hypothetical protein
MGSPQVERGEGGRLVDWLIGFLATGNWQLEPGTWNLAVPGLNGIVD